MDIPKWITWGKGITVMIAMFLAGALFVMLFWTDDVPMRTAVPATIIILCSLVYSVFQTKAIAREIGRLKEIEDEAVRLLIQTVAEKNELVRDVVIGARLESLDDCIDCTLFSHCDPHYEEWLKGRLEADE